MAEVDEKNRTAEGRDVERSQQRGEMTRRRDYDYFPSLFDTSGGELFSMRPFALFRRMSEEMDRMFSSWAGRGSEAGEGRVWWPAIEVSQDKGQLNICAEVPGVKPEDVKVEVSDDELVIRGERKQEQTERREGMYRSERSYGQFFRRIPLPEGAKANEAKADFSNGELRIRIPVAEQERRHREIKIGSGETKK